MLQEFKKFAVRGNVVDMAVGIIIGAAFSAIVNSLVNDIIMPPVGLLMGNVDFTDLFVVLRPGAEATGPYMTLAEAQAAGAVTLNYGMFVNNIVSFLIVAFAIFMLVRTINRIREREEVEKADPATKKCPYCDSEISIKASRCPQCTSELSPA